MNKIVAALLMMLPLCTVADLLPSPLPGEMPLHRIGYEIVFEILTALAVGGATFRALLKRRWKLRDEISMAERESFRQKIDSAMPRLLEEIVKANKTWAQEFREVVSRTIAENQELSTLAEGVAIDDIGEAFCKGIFDRITGQCRFGQEIGEKLKALMPKLHHALADNNCNIELNHKALLEKALANNDDLREELDGVPIELLNESLVPLLPSEVRVDRGSWRDGSLWMAEEDRSEQDALCRKRYRSPYERMLKHELELEKKLRAEIQRFKQQDDVRVRDLSGLSVQQMEQMSVRQQQ